MIKKLYTNIVYMYALHKIMRFEEHSEYTLV